ncbi:hypothetical protein LZ30DRAFT_345626 [Colletotrichum cereale]|nr:hypothetical protein LZ30DRAFT_345626 [Colletotrichum cereale]
MSMPQADIEPSHSDSGTEDVDWLLNRVEVSTRGPNGFQEAWKNNDDPAGEAFKVDFVTWIAYYATKQAVQGSSTFTNKALLKRRFDALITSDPENQQKIARQLKIAIKDPLHSKLLQWQHIRLHMPATQTDHADKNSQSRSPTDEDIHYHNTTRKRQRKLVDPLPFPPTSRG